MSDRPQFIPGGLAVDDRGRLAFCNDFGMGDVKRMYVVSNHAPQFVRAWHAHKHERKYVFAVTGAAVVAAVEIDDWEMPDKSATVHRFVLSEAKPGVLAIPPGYANGFMTLVAGTALLFFSTATVAESEGDDYRFDAAYWNPWDIVPR